MKKVVGEGYLEGMEGGINRLTGSSSGPVGVISAPSRRYSLGAKPQDFLHWLE